MISFNMQKIVEKIITKTKILYLFYLHHLNQQFII